MFISLTGLLSLTWKIIRRDALVIVPYVALFLVADMAQTWIPGISLDTFASADWRILAVTWASELSIKSLTLVLAYNALQPKPQRVLALAKTFFTGLPKVFLTTGIFTVPMMVFFQLYPIQPLSKVNPQLTLIIFIGLLVIIPISFIIEFIPPAVFILNKGFFTAVSASFIFVKSNVRNILLLMLLALCTLILSLLMGALFKSIPYVGPMLNTVMQGLGYGFLYTMQAIFVMMLSKPVEKASA
jgi:hypothetical protein